MNGIAGRRHCRQPRRLEQLPVIPHQHAVRPHQPLRPVSRRNHILARLHTIPLAQMQCGPMQNITVAGRKTDHGAHRETAEYHERHVLRRKVDVVEQYALGEAARNESGVVRIQNGREDDLLEAIIVVGAKRIDFGASRLRNGGATVERCAVQVGGRRWALEGGAQEGLESEAERDEVDGQRIDEVEHANAAVSMVESVAADTEEGERCDKERNSVFKD